MQVHFCDEFEHGFGWIASKPAWMQRCSHALRVDGRVWLVDAVDGERVEERIRALGEPAGVVHLLSRHSRDSDEFARRLGVPVYRSPFTSLPEAPFTVLPIVRMPGWREVALWWPHARVLVCGDALATLRPYRAPGEMLAVHPLLRLTPPRRLGWTMPRHILVGHGEGVHGDAADGVLQDTLAGSRRRTPSLVVKAARYHLPGPLRKRPEG